MTPLRIAMIADLFTPLPPKNYGGVERVLYSLSEALHASGHDVTIFGPEETTSSCKVIPFGHVLGEQYPTDRRAMIRLWKLLHRRHREFDVIHNFFRAAYLLPVLPRSVPKIISYACPLNPRVIRLTDFVGGSSMHYAVCAEHMMSQLPAHTDRSKWHRIYNPINIRSCTFQETPAAAEPYLVFLSRMCIAKGPHHAIAVAKKTGRRLVLAGNVQATDQSYFDEAVKPHIDGKQISYIGPVNDDQKRELLGNADAMLFPITWEEPFGLVVGESLACGTPVLAFKRGAMPELIEDGRTGILCDTEEEMCAAVEKIPTLDRKECRILVESRFSPEIIAVEFERVYREMLNQPK